MCSRKRVRFPLAGRAGRWTVPLGLVIALAAAQAEDASPPLSQPTKEHIWLQKFVGEWEMQTGLTMQPGEPPIRMDGTETVRAIGPFWIVGESRSDAMGMPFINVITIGYDPQRERFVARSIDSASSHLWTYEGEFDPQTGRLTLTWEGPCMMHSGRTMQFRGETEFRNDDERVFTASVRGDEGEWTQIVVSTFRRKN
jgi:hypothetical protein